MVPGWLGRFVGAWGWARLPELLRREPAAAAAPAAADEDRAPSRLRVVLWLHAEALQQLLGLALVVVALLAVDWRLGTGVAGAVLYLERHLQPRPRQEPSP